MIKWKLTSEKRTDLIPIITKSFNLKHYPRDIIIVHGKNLPWSESVKTRYKQSNEKEPTGTRSKERSKLNSTVILRNRLVID